MYKHRALVFPPSVFGQVKPSETAGHERLQTLHLFLSPKRCSYAYQAVELVWDASKKMKIMFKCCISERNPKLDVCFCCSCNSDTSSLLGKQWFCKSDVCCRKMGWNWPLPSRTLGAGHPWSATRFCFGNNGNFLYQRRFTTHGTSKRTPSHVAWRVTANEIKEFERSQFLLIILIST